MEHRRHQQTHGLAEIEQLTGVGVIEHAFGVAEVGRDEPGVALAGQQGVGVHPDQRVVVHVDDAGVRGHLAHRLVGVVLGRQARPEVEELMDALGARHPPGRPLVKPAVRPGRVGQLRHPGPDLLGRVPVGREVVVAPL